METSPKSPVIGPISMAAMKDHANTMKANLEVFKADTATAKANLVGPAAADPNDAGAAATDMRNTETGHVLGEIGASEEGQGFVYTFNGQPVGLMVVKVQEGAVKVEWLVTDPLSAGAGGALMEAAVTYSEQMNKQGVVTLSAMTPNAFKAYKALGFAGEPHPFFGTGTQTLTPSSKTGWTKTDGAWALTRHAGKSFAVGFGQA